MKDLRNPLLNTVTLTAIFLCACAAAAEKGLVELEVAGLAEGPIVEWANTGSAGGVFKSAGAPQVKTVDGVKAVEFSGKDHFLADFLAPASITGDKPWTVIVRARCTNIRGEHALVAWSSRPGNCLEIEYGDTLNWGAVGTWNDPNTLGWAKDPPAVGKWHTLIYSYAGGQNGEMQAWCDGEKFSSKKVTLNTKPDKGVVIGGCQFEDGPDKYSLRALRCWSHRQRTGLRPRVLRAWKSGMPVARTRRSPCCRWATALSRT